MAPFISKHFKVWDHLLIIKIPHLCWNIEAISCHWHCITFICLPIYCEAEGNEEKYLLNPQTDILREKCKLECSQVTKLNICVLSHFCCVWLFASLWTVAHQAPLSMGFSGQEYWSGLPFPSPGDLPYPEIKPGSPTLQADSLPSEPLGKPKI